MAKRDGKPPWIARNPRERQQMKDWLTAKLDAYIDADDKMAELGKQLADPNVQAAMLAITKRQLAELRAGDFPFEQAEGGNVEPLRHKYEREDPRLVPFIHLSPRKRGQRRKTQPDWTDAHSRLAEALREKQLIHRLWQDNFEGKKNRPKGQLTAEEFLAERWHLTADEVRSGRLSRRRLKRARAP